MHDLIDGNFDNGSFLKTLHDSYTIIVVPIMNPFGFNIGSRYNYNNVDLNRDWTNCSSIAVPAAKQLITDIDPFMILDVHGNGAMPTANGTVALQVGFGETYNSLYQSACRNYLKSYYNTDVLTRLPNTADTLQYYILNVFNKLGGLLEMRWWLGENHFHDRQVESANYSLLVNTIKYFVSIKESSQFEYEHTPNQQRF